MKNSLAIKQAAVATLLALGTLTASAAVRDLGAISSGPAPTAFNSGWVSPGFFEDYFTFTLPSNKGSGYSILDFEVPGFDNYFSSIGLYSNANGIAGDGDDILLAVTSSTSPTTNTLSVTFGASPAGNYLLKIKGKAIGSLGGLYSGAISVTPVPEPETVAMLLAGLGVIGVAARRRKLGSKTPMLA